MARNMYGATSADFTLTSGGRVVPGATLTIWSARTGGTQITDLLDVDSVATTTVTSDADGSIVYYGPNNDKTVHWADSGVGSRIAIRPVDITGDPPVLSIGTVGTGAAAASLTGTSEAPVLNLTLPSAGANGVNTAAIQNDAVTSDKIAADAVGTSEIAAGAVGTSELADAAVTAAKLGSDVRIGNLLTSNQASGTDTLSDTTGFETSGSGATLASTTAQARQGTRCLQSTASGAGNAACNTTGGTGGIPVAPGQTMTAVLSARSASSTGSAIARILWFNAAGTYLSASDSAAVTSSTSAWVDLTVTAVAPASAAFACAAFSISGASASSVHYIDQWGLWKGAGGVWAMPGQPILGLTDGLAGIGNLLTAAQAIGDGGWASDGTVNFGTAGDGAFSITTAWTYCVVSQRIPATAGDVVTFSATLSPVGGRAEVVLTYKNAATGGSETAAQTVGNSIAAGQTGRAQVTAVVPAGTTHIEPVFYGYAPMTSTTFSRISVHRGSGGQWSPPNQPIVGQSHIATNGAVHLSGTGSPEGVVTAAPGSTWLQTDATTDVKGWIRWVKATGTGNTGWVAGPEADTGLLTIATALTPGSDITIHYAHIRRTGFVVTLSADVTFGGITTASAVPLFTIPAGFQPQTIPIRDTLAASSDGTPEVRNLFIRDADVALYGATSSKRYRFVLTWHTADAWQSSLPGSAA